MTYHLVIKTHFKTISMKLLSKTLLISILFLFIFIGCEEEVEFIQPPAAVSFDKNSMSVEIDPDNPTVEISIQTSASLQTDILIPFLIVHDTLDDLNYTAPVVDYTLNNTVIKIPAGKMNGSTTIQFDKNNLGYVKKGLKFKLSDGDYLKNVSREELTLDYTKLCKFKKAILTITTDEYPEENHYELYEIVSGGQNLLQSGGPYDGDEYKETDINTTFCLDTGRYAVVVYDKYGDGITAGGFKVSLDGVELVSKTVAGRFGVGYFDIP